MRRILAVRPGEQLLHWPMPSLVEVAGELDRPIARLRLTVGDFILRSGRDAPTAAPSA
jgi:hypothetical protein